MNHRVLVLLACLSLACRTTSKVEPAEAGLDTGGLASVDADGDGFAASEDCDDNDASVNGGAVEICDGIDNDCDGEVDEGVSNTYYEDADADGYGSDAVSTEACATPEGYTTSGTDCDDTDPAINPAAPEQCDGIDNNCDGSIDDGVRSTWYADADGDGFGDPDSPVEACEPADGLVDNSGDCDDSTDAVSPDAEEVCDGQDNDCDGDIDEADALDAPTWYRDNDGDGYGDPSAAQRACSQPSAHVSDNTDCSDADFDVNPAAAEVCNGIDDDCDGAVDDDDASVDLSTAPLWYTDGDGDGYGSAAVQSCAQPSGTVTDNTDCNDASAAINPGATEICNGTDDDCDGLTDDDDASLDTATASTWYADADADGYGNASSPTLACAQPARSVSDATDCDDSRADVNPGETEICNSLDDDCDGLVDDDDGSLDSSTATDWYPDTDLDGYGDASGAVVTACDEPSGFTDDDSDCDDDATDVNPGATEDCNGYDDDCDGFADSTAVCPCNVEYRNGDTSYPYLFCTTAASWTAGRNTCLNVNYDLAAIGSASEDSWLNSTADTYSTQKWWTGFNDRASEGTWEWSNGETVSYTNWNSGEPNNSGGNEDCGQLNRFSGTTWNDEPCGASFRYICEVDL